MHIKKNVKIVKDSFGKMEVPADKYWGAQTQRSLINFKINDEKMPMSLIYSLVNIKKACAIANLVPQDKLSYDYITPLALDKAVANAWKNSKK